MAPSARIFLCVAAPSLPGGGLTGNRRDWLRQPARQDLAQQFNLVQAAGARVKHNLGAADLAELCKLGEDLPSGG
jgi:hypothetical protein